QQELLKFNKSKPDSLNKVEASKIKLQPTIIQPNKINTALQADSTNNKEQLTALENEFVKIFFSNKGAQVKKVILKKYNKEKQPVILGNDNAFCYSIIESTDKESAVNNVYFQQINQTNNQSIEYQYTTLSGNIIKHTYSLNPSNYDLNFNISIQSKNGLLSNKDIQFDWNVIATQQEKGINYEKQQLNVCFSVGNEFDYYSSDKQINFEKPIQWVSLVQQFFNSSLILPSNVIAKNAQLSWSRNPSDTLPELATMQTHFTLKTSDKEITEFTFQYYFGPNDLKILKVHQNNMDEIVNFGRGMYAFVRPINVYVIAPIFSFFSTFISNFGWCVLLLTIVIKILTAPLTYSSYVSGAKMKALKPELDALKAKFGSDQQGFAMEQMKLFREAGVNPLGGCIPALLTIPIFFALYSFFNANLILRGQPFLWSPDLSSFDVIYQMPFNIPLYGSHISLFCLTAVLTTFLSSIYNMQMTPTTQDNPALKYMPYIFPFMMLFIFNSMPSALTWYYTVANIITLILQFIIQKFIINHDKILEKIQQKRKEPKKKTKWQEKYESMLQTQKNVQKLKDKTKK
ncbi:MAG: membrane protein insertase YidC, partial [Sediminibacterium sp.]|nr:membrane protein insertase YidC [Sediminibacterium sp.]